jgi:hypothetical protein
MDSIESYWTSVPDVSTPSLAALRRSTGRGVQAQGGEIDPADLLPVGESGF